MKMFLICLGRDGERIVQYCPAKGRGLNYVSDYLVMVQVMKWYSPKFETMETQATSRTT